MKLLCVPRQRFRVGNKNLTVEEFHIMRRPVTLSEFALFAKMSGYVADTVRNKLEFTPFSNPAIEGIPFPEIAESYVTCISLDDAVAFCDHFEVSLPTCNQWLALASFVRKFWSNTRRSARATAIIQYAGSGREWLSCSVPMQGEPPVMARLPQMVVPAKSALATIHTGFRAVVPVLNLSGCLKGASPNLNTVGH
jgi:hypothetical protein